MVAETGKLPNAFLVWIPADGGDANLILPSRGSGGAHFTHEKDRIYVNTPGGLVSLRYDGTDRRTHLILDGEWVLAHVQNQLYVIALPVVGGEPPTVDVGSPTVPIKRLTDIGADWFGWADDGKTITWAVGASYFRQPLSSVSFEPPKDEKKDGEGKDKKDADKKESADAKSDAKSDDKKDGDKKDAKKEEKKFKEQEKDVTEIAVDVEVPRKTPKGTVVLRGATVVTMNGDEVLKNADIVVEDNRIKRVGARGSVPSGAKVIDVAGKT